MSLDPQGWTYALQDEEYDRLHYSDDNGGGGEGGDGGGGDAGDEFVRAFEERFFGAGGDVRGGGAGANGTTDTNSKKRSPTAVVEVGDTVQFFVTDPTGFPPTVSPSPTSSPSTTPTTSLVFGCIPKDTHLPPAEPSASGDEVSYAQGRVRRGISVRGLFGGRGEEGVWIHGGEREGDEEGYRGGDGNGGGDRGGVRGGRGKMDVPGGEVLVLIDGGGMGGIGGGGGEEGRVWMGMEGGYWEGEGRGKRDGEGVGQGIVLG